jgi:hypothetical protein
LLHAHPDLEAFAPTMAKGYPEARSKLTR